MRIMAIVELVSGIRLLLPFGNRSSKSGKPMAFWVALIFSTINEILSYVLDVLYDSGRGRDSCGSEAWGGRPTVAQTDRDLLDVSSIEMRTAAAIEQVMLIALVLR